MPHGGKARKVLAVGLLAVLPFIAVLGPAIVVGVAVFLLSRGNLLLLGLVPAVVATTGASMRSLLAFDRKAAVPGARWSVSPAEQPWLWSLAREAAAEAGTFAPDRVVLVSEPEAGAVDHTRWFGLRHTGRSLVVGAPVLLGLSRTELRAALVRSFALHAHAGLDAVVQRGAGSMMRVPDALAQPGLHWFTAPLVRSLAALTCVWSPRRTARPSPRCSRCWPPCGRRGGSTLTTSSRWPGPRVTGPPTSSAASAVSSAR
ncbi:hypothetical protein VSH64_34090 [Amycolatopsis rhabdoformis]|uniref:M48 family metalloprotease n=1 Tax=Amycolatopsis rhabdoformis TaxID=1448059 RepID=A0ABZ1I2H0_9PSEU|nr:hypothetical protein [Amycolatopsis rhabdoformis]WSE27850.1 hypothetical protein VSH64_34090 [Amycolatopsis rhabdoformis]